MLFPSLCVDDFFNDIDYIKKQAEQFRFHRTDHVPGYRTDNIALLDYELYNYINLKVLAALYPCQLSDLKFDAFSTFQITDSNPYDGWVHKDDVDSILTAIVYLTDCTAGTSVYKPKDPKKIMKFDDNSDGGKHTYFGNYEDATEDDLKNVENNRKFVNDHYDESIIFKGRRNRMVCFDAREYHAAHINTENKQRMIFITFFKQIWIDGEAIYYHVPSVKSL